MAPRAQKKEETRADILQSAMRGFRSRGYGGLGVDGLAKEAGVTSGAFYAHFKSKAEAFREAIRAGMDDMRGHLERLRTQHGEGWRDVFRTAYLDDRRRADLAHSCTFQSLTGEVARADDDSRRAYEAKLKDVLSTMDGPGEGAMRRQDAIALLAMLSGGVSMARAVDSPEFADEIAAAIKDVAARLDQGTDTSQGWC
jgi:TetR/AcrR family transcriptional regulator, transcriptional repressor for nem operon